MSSVSVIIPARNAAGTLGETLMGLESQDFEGAWEAIVVDNGSTDATAAIARASRVVSYVVRIEGAGPADSRNAGAAAARGDTLVFLDSDCRPTESWLTRGTEALGDSDLVQGAVLPDPIATVGLWDRTLWISSWTGLYESANIFMRRELLDSVGGFEHWLGVGSANQRPFGEDVWFGWRARRLGYRTAFCEQALVYHAVFPRRATEYVSERLRLRFFPPMARRIPELREHFFYRRCFLTRRSAAYDAALVGCALALGSRRWIALAATAPYLHVIAPRVLGGGPRNAGKMMLAELGADSVGFIALVAGSISSGSVVL